MCLQLSSWGLCRGKLMRLWKSVGDLAMAAWLSDFSGCIVQWAGLLVRIGMTVR